jgi:hypothetical protein
VTEAVTVTEAETATEAATATDSAFGGSGPLPSSPTTAVAASTDTTLALAALTATALPVASDRAPLGVNLEGLWDWARLQPFADAMKSSRPWGTPEAPWDEAAAVDALGWPTGDAGVVVNVRTFEPGDEGKQYRYMTPGVYRLRFTGRATVAPAASAGVEIRNYAYDLATNKSQADVVVGSAATQLMLTFRNTVNGVKDVSLRLPDYSDTQTFTKQFIQALAPFQVVRFMDFLRTNNNPSVNWSERTRPHRPRRSAPRERPTSTRSRSRTGWARTSGSTFRPWPTTPTSARWRYC